MPTRTIPVVGGYDGIQATVTHTAEPAVPTGSLEDLDHDDPHHISTAGAISIGTSAFSIIVSLFTIYWFLRMRRRYRHDLIMMLTLANAFRAFWRLLFPVVEYFKHGVFPTDSVFCQITGFFLSVGVEATDIAALLIAAHSALSVFSKRTVHNHGGLYPYRRWAFAFWIIFPLTIASVAFTNPDQKGYSAQGHICYLPSRPYRYINLTWIPRYIIAVFIVVVYTSIYVYASRKSYQYQREVMGLSRFETFDKKGWLARIGLRLRKGKGRQTSQEENLMTAKEIRNFNRGLQLSRSNWKPYGPYSGPNYLLDSSLELETGAQAADHHPRLPGGRYGFPEYELQVLSRPTSPKDSRPNEDFQPQPMTKTVTDATTSDAHDFAQGITGTAAELEAPQTQAAVSDRRRSSAMRVSPIQIPETAVSRRSSVAPTLRRSSVADSLTSTSSIPSSVASSLLSRTDTENDVPRMMACSSIIAQHERMRRQLRYLFFYPAAYVILWIAPFVQHIVRVTPGYYQDPSFVLTAFVIVSACIHAAVDGIIFSLLEKPWRHIPGSDGSFLGSFKCFAIRRRRAEGQTQDPQVVRERLARQLADLERLDQRSLESDLSRPRIKTPRASHEGPRYWWEQYEDDEDEMGRRRSQRRVSWADGTDDEQEEERGRERRRRVSFPDEHGQTLEREIARPRSESLPPDDGSKSSRSSSIRQGADDWHKDSRTELEPEERGGVDDKKGTAANVGAGAESGHRVRLNEAGHVEEGENIERELPPSSEASVESEDHG